MNRVVEVPIQGETLVVTYDRDALMRARTRTRTSYLTKAELDYSELLAA